jgi:hypothetical protein
MNSVPRRASSAYPEDQFMAVMGLFSHEFALHNVDAYIAQPSAVR